MQTNRDCLKPQMNWMLKAWFLKYLDIIIKEIWDNNKEIKSYLHTSKDNKEKIMERLMEKIKDDVWWK